MFSHLLKECKTNQTQPQRVGCSILNLLLFTSSKDNYTSSKHSDSQATSQFYIPCRCRCQCLFQSPSPWFLLLWLLLHQPVLGDKVFAHLRGSGNVTAYYGIVQFEYPTIATGYTRVTYSLEGLPPSKLLSMHMHTGPVGPVIAVMQTSLLVTGIQKTRIMKATLISRVTSAIWATF
jgi:hypothetical protein